MNKSQQQRTSLGGDAVILSASRIVTLGISMLTSMLLSRFRTLEEYGTYSQLLLATNLFTSILMLGLPNSINFFLARAENAAERRKFLSVYYTLSTLLSFLTGAALLAALPLIERYFENPLISRFFYFLALYPWSNIISSSIENVLIVYKRSRFLMVYRILHSACMLLPVIAVQFLGLGFPAYVGAFIFLNALFALSVYGIAAWLGGGLSICLDRRRIRAIFAFSIPIGLATAVSTLSIEIDKLLIGYLMNTEELAIYTNAAKELPVTIIASSITAVLMPQLARMLGREKNREAVRLWACATELSFILLALIAAGIFTYAEEVISILYSTKYLPGASVFRVYTLNLLLRCTYFGMILNACGETKKIFYCSILSLLFNAAFNPLFYWLFGMIGPAIATFLAILLVQAVQLYMTAKHLRIPFRDIFPWKPYGKILAFNFVFAAVFHAIKELCPLDRAVGGVAESVLLGIIWSGCYLLFMRKRILKLWNTLNTASD